jgi:hypothetical protein
MNAAFMLGILKVFDDEFFDEVVGGGGGHGLAIFC